MPEKILVVDDEPDFRLILTDVLSRAGYEVVQATNGEEALAKLAFEQPQLVIIDWMMPGMSGPDFCQAVRQNLNMPKLPIIMLTVRRQDEDHAEGIHQGADLFLSKPVVPDELLLRVRSLLRRAESPPQNP